MLPHIEKIYKILSKSNIFQELSKYQLTELSLAVKVKKIEPNSYLIKESETHNKIYFLVQGELLITKTVKLKVKEQYRIIGIQLIKQRLKKKEAREITIMKSKPYDLIGNLNSNQFEYNVKTNIKPAIVWCFPKKFLYKRMKKDQIVVTSDFLKQKEYLRNKLMQKNIFLKENTNKQQKLRSILQNRTERLFTLRKKQKQSKSYDNPKSISLRQKEFPNSKHNLLFNDLMQMSKNRPVKQKRPNINAIRRSISLAQKAMSKQFYYRKMYSNTRRLLRELTSSTDRIKVLDLTLN